MLLEPGTGNTAVISASQIAENLRNIRERIAETARRSGRAPDSVQLLAVSKRQPLESIRAAYAAGQRAFGENYAQELVARSEQLSDLPELEWHMIGHIQTNKARHVVRSARWIHTLDSVKLVREVGKRARALEAPQVQRFALVEVNVAQEPQKSGCSPSELWEILEAIEQEPSLRLSGLMTVPPRSDNPEASQHFFEELVHLQQQHGGRSRLPELSMGMSSDFEVAIAAGATIVRIGSAVFGPRPS